MNTNSSVNIEASRNRHKLIDFQQGIYQKNKQEYSKSLKSFVKKVFWLFFIFCLSYSLTYNHNSYAQVDTEPLYNLEEKKVFVLGEEGFVTKPSTQTEQGDRSRSHDVITYTIESGDTLSALAARFSIRTKTIIDNNPGLNEWTPLKVGQKLKILPVDGLLVQVKSGDSASVIASRYKIKTEDLVRQNELDTRDLIAGMDLIVPGVSKPRVSGNNNYLAGGSYQGTVSGRFIWPTNGKVTQYFHRGHYAVDIANRKKGPIFASDSGLVTKASYGWNGGYGNMVVVDHGNGFKTLYAHNEVLYVKVGQEVKQGDRIAWMGNTGRVRGATGIHLHFEIIYNGVKKNPLAYLKR